LLQLLAHRRIIKPDPVPARLDRLTPALLAKAFRGELVPQDPNDEPAEKLLARLRESSQGMIKPVKKGRKPKSA